MTTELILRSFLHNYRSITVPFTGKAFFNATVAAKAFDKQPSDWLRTQDTKDYVEAVRNFYGTEQDQLVIVRQGGEPNEQGTWLHPKLAIQFARWLHPEFAVWCDMQIEEILRGNRGVAAMPAPNSNLRPYTPAPYNFEQELDESQTVVLETKTLAEIISEKKRYRSLYENTLERLDMLKNRYTHLLEKLVEQGIKP